MADGLPSPKEALGSGDEKNEEKTQPQKWWMGSEAEIKADDRSKWGANEVLLKEISSKLSRIQW